jgi:phosphatidylserine/phosphatidylglycerophosphate/cardiolipin synthase-like enzyme
VVIYGSHNFNASGTHGNDELDLEIHDASLAQLLAERFETQAQTHAVEVSADFLNLQRHRHAFGISFGKLFPGLF